MTSQIKKRVSNACDDLIIGAGPQAKKSKTGSASSSKQLTNLARKTDVNGDSYWEISKMRRVTVSSFRGKTMVSIREYYEKDGQELPGKKGISLPIDQFSNFVTLLPDIENIVRESGVSVARPEYIGSSTSPEGENADDNSDEESHEASSSRKNIEATSDEDESDG